VANIERSVVSFDGSQPARPVGVYTYVVAEDRWIWSDAVYVLHGYQPREIPATTRALLQHKHPDDRVRAAEVLESAVRTGEPFSCYHRIVDRSQRVRSVLSVGRGIKVVGDVVERVEGYFVDLTEVRRDETEAEVSVALTGIAEHREAIDLAKGMIMLACRCDAEQAFEVLRQWSQNRNVKVHDIARAMVDAVGTDITGSDDVLDFLAGLGGPRR
jgi:ANTAR domain/PAS fold